MDLYLKNAYQISKVTTNNYSTSFSLGVRTLKKEYQWAIYAIYGFVRFADEIVDTFHKHDKKRLLDKFREDTYEAIHDGISTNPILHSFQQVVKEYNIDIELIDAFLNSMEMDLYYTAYNKKEFKKYVYGSAEVVGLMCLKVFYKKDPETYGKLKYPARKLGEAFQKVNFLRDAQADYKERGRMYFPKINFDNLTFEDKIQIEREIEQDFQEAWKGIVQLHEDVRLGVYLSYIYYKKLFKKIQNTTAPGLLIKRHRISNASKLKLLFISSFKYKLNLL